ISGCKDKKIKKYRLHNLLDSIGLIPQVASLCLKSIRQHNKVPFNAKGYSTSLMSPTLSKNNADRRTP
ncbi:hypothetical protein ACWKSR_12280, partial [Campylobacter fetus subsp. venerealis]